MPDEPRAPEYPHILKLAENVHSNPGPGRALPIFVTSAYVDALAPAIDIWCAGPKGFQLDRVAAERARGRQFWFYNGGRPEGGAITIDAPATDARATIWAAFKHDAPRVFLLARRALASQLAETGRARPERLGRKHHVRQPGSAEQAD